MRRMTNCPGFCLRAMRCASITNRLIPGARNCAWMILNTGAPLGKSTDSPTNRLCSGSHQAGCDLDHKWLCGEFACLIVEPALKRRSTITRALLGLVPIRFIDHSLARLAVHHNSQGLFELQMTNAAALFAGGLI